MAANLELVPAAAGKRLGAAVLDWLAPVAVLLVTFAIGFTVITRSQSGGYIIHDTGSLVLFGGIGLGLTLVHLVVRMGMEGRSGMTLGNHVMGIRSADRGGYASGGGGVFLCGLINDGRNPITSGGIQGPYSFAPLNLPPVRQVASAPRWFAPEPYEPPSSTPFHAPHALTAATAVPGPAAHSHPDDGIDRTRMRGGATYAAPVAVLLMKLDDGRDFRLDPNVLLGRNPLGQAGEQPARLLSVNDPGRSICKTHRRLLTDGAGIWVTDRNSTSGSAITTPDGRRTPLQAGVPAFVSPGSTVLFGDRSFHLGQA